MEKMYISRVILLGLLIVLCFAVYFLIKMQRKTAKINAQTKIVVKKPTRSRKLYKLYARLAWFKPTRHYIDYLCSIYEVRLPGDLRSARENAVKTALKIWTVGLLVIIGNIIFGSSLYIFLTSLLLIYVISDQFVISKINSLDVLIIRELLSLTREVSHNFKITKDVEIALGEAIENAKPTVKRHASKILEVISHDDIDVIEEEIQKYMDALPNYFLKSFLEIVAITKIYGDRVVENKSTFQESLRQLRSDIQSELLYREELDSKFYLLNACIAFPILSLEFIENWAIGCFIALKDFYEGSYGVIAKALLFLLTFAIYQTTKRLKNSTKVDTREEHVLAVIYDIPLMSKFIEMFLQKNWSKTLKLHEFLKKTGSNIDEKLFAVKRFLYAFLGGLFALLILLFVQIEAKQRYANSVTALSSTTSGASDEEAFEMMMIGKYELTKFLKHDIIRDFKEQYGVTKAMVDKDTEELLKDLILSDINQHKYDLNEVELFPLIDAYLQEHASSTLILSNLEGLSYEEASKSKDSVIIASFSYFQDLVKAWNSGDMQLKDSLNEIIANEIASQIRKYQNTYFHWYNVPIIALIVIIFYNVPLLLLEYEKKALQMDMTSEIVQYQSVIMILMHVESMKLETVLDWLLAFSNIFKPSLQKCINNLPLNEDAALQELIKDEPFEDLTVLIKDLMACDATGIKNAFNAIASDRSYYQADRELTNKMSLEKKSVIATSIATVPLMAVVVFYVVVPFAIVAYSEMTSALQQAASYL